VADEEHERERKRAVAVELSDWRISQLEKGLESLTSEVRRDYVNAKEFRALKSSLEKRADGSSDFWLNHITAPIITALVVGLIILVGEHIWPVAAAGLH